MTKTINTSVSNNQQLLDYAVENIKEWHNSYNYLRADGSHWPLFYTEDHGWHVDHSVSYSYWTSWSGSYQILYEQSLGKTTPQVITKAEWLAEIKRRKDEPHPSKFKLGERVRLDSPWFSKYNGEYEVIEVVFEPSFYDPDWKSYPTWKYRLGIEGESYWLESSLHKIEEKPMVLKQDAEYDVKLTGQEIFDLYLITGSLQGGYKLYNKFQAMLGDNINAHTSLDVYLPTIWLTGAEGYATTVAKAFKVPETEEERHLRELKEQYEALGEKIKQLSK